jgi:hypothetical protein
LHDQAKNQIEVKLFHKVFPGGTQILLHKGWGLGREIRGFCGDDSAKTGPGSENQEFAYLYDKRDIANQKPHPAAEDAGGWGMACDSAQLFPKFQCLRQFKGDV